MLIQLFSGIAYIHSELLVHRDIKPENILIEQGPDDENTTLKIADFGWNLHFVAEDYFE